MIVDLNICGTEYSLFNIYAPNLEKKQGEQTAFWTEINDYLDKRRGSKFIIGGDMNVNLNGALDKNPSNTKRYESVEKFKTTLDEYKIVDIWRIKNPEMKGYSWRRANSVLIQSRLYYWLVSTSIMHNLKHIELLPGIKTDHSAIWIKCLTPKVEKRDRVYKSFLLHF